MISTISWVPKGASKPVPIVAEPPSQEEIDEILKSTANKRSEDVGSDEEDEEIDMDAIKNTSEVAQALAVAESLGQTSKGNNNTNRMDDVVDGFMELNMDNYDEEDDGVELFSSGLGDRYYASNELDPYMKDKDDEDSEDLEDMAINPSDLVIVCARNEEDLSHLEVWIYEESEGADSNMYVHHEIIIPDFPLCLAWLDCLRKGGEKGNFIAVGSMGPSIEIWDLDIVDEVQPCAVLGGIAENQSKKKGTKKGKKASIKYKEGSHTDSVLGLAWNNEYRSVLASASADTQVKIWDISVGECKTTMEHHTDKVQAVAWNPHKPEVLLSGSFDRTVVMRDGRTPSHTGYKTSLMAEIESLAWDPHTEHSFVVSLENGTVQGFDIRAVQTDQESVMKPTFTLHAHDKEVTSISYNPSAPNLLATGSADKMVKLWDLSNNQPSCIASKNPKAGAVFSVSFAADNPYLLAVGGSKGILEVWDTRSEAAIMNKFGSKMK